MTKSADDKPGATARLAKSLGGSQRLLHVAATVFSLSILGLSLFVLFRTFSSVHWTDLRTALERTGWDQISMACLLTSCSYLALTGYDAVAQRQLKLKVPLRRTALASFTSYAISFTLGFPLITGGTVRYWIYSQSGLSAGKVANLTIVAGITFWLGMGLVIGVALVVDPAGIADINHFQTWINVLLGLATLSLLAGWLAWVSGRRRHIRVQGVGLDLPGFRLTVAQMALGVVDLSAASGTLYALLPRGASMHFLDFAGVYAFASLLGIASNAPGGLGAFEVTLLHAVPAPSPEGVIASLLMFRVVYYLLPFVLALAILGAHEIVRRWASLRADFDASEDD